MPSGSRRHGRINVKAVLVLLAVLVVLGAAAVVGHYVRKRMIAAEALAAGQAAFDKGNWTTAHKQFKRYLSKYPNDTEVLAQYAEAHSSVQPLSSGNVAAALSAYRRLIRFEPAHDGAYEALATLYTGIRDWGELAYIAKKRMEVAPDDPKAPIWLAKAQAGLRRPDEAKQTLLDLVERLQDREANRRELVEACLLLSRVTDEQEGDESAVEAKSWLDRAVAADPKSAMALAYRARFSRTHAPSEPGPRQQALAAAEADLIAAEKLDSPDPRVDLMICEEWLLHGRIERSEQALNRIKDVGEDVAKEYFFDPADWTAAKYVARAELRLARRKADACAALADEMTQEVTYPRQRMAILPYAVRLLVVGGRPSVAAERLEEYVDMVRVGETDVELDRRVTFLRALIAQEQNKPQQVIELLEPEVTQSGADPTMWRMLARAYEKTGQPRRSEQAYQEFVRLQPDNAAALLDLARDALRQRNWLAAEQAARRAEAIATDSVTAKVLRLEAQIQEATDDPEPQRQTKLEAITDELAALHDKHPKQVDIRLLQAAAAQVQGQPDKAIAELRSAIDECDQTLKASLQLARYLLSLGRPDEAIGAAEAACKRHADQVAPWRLLARLQQSSGKTDQAGATLERGIASVTSDQGQRVLRRRLAVLRVLGEDRPEGITMLKQMAQEGPTDVQTRSLLLALPEIQKDAQAAQKLVDEIRTAQGEGGLLWREQQAALWLTQPDWRTKREEIVKLLEQCVDAAPGRSRPVLMLGQLYERLGERAQAESVYRRALAQGSAAAEIADRLIALLQRDDRLSEAREVMARIDTRSGVLGLRRVSLALDAGDLEKAIDELKLQLAGENQDVARRVLLARLLYRQTGNADVALQELAKAERLAPDEIGIKAVRVAILRAADRLDEARKLVDDLAKSSKTFEAYILKASLLASLGEKGAEDAYKQAAETATDDQGYLAWGLYHHNEGRLDEAIAVWDQGLEAYPKSQRLKRRIMRTLFQRDGEGDRQRGLAMLDELEKASPEDPDLMWYRALVMLRAGGAEARDDAAKLLRRVIELAPSAVDAYLALIGMAGERGDYAEARDLANRGLAANPRSRRLLLARAKAEHQLGNTSLAVRLATTIVTEDPSNADAGRFLADAAAGLTDPAAQDSAIDVLGRLAEDNPKQAWIVPSLGKLLQATGKTDEGIRRLETYLAGPEGAKDGGAMLTLADLYRTQEAYDKAAKMIDRAEALSPGSSAVVLARSVLLGAQGEFDDVVRRAKAYADSKEEPDPSVLISAASILADSPSHRKAAIELLEKAVKIDPTNRQAMHGMAVLLYQTGQVERAKSICRTMLERNPNDTDALNDLAWMLAQVDKDYEAALPLADKGVALAPANPHLLDTRGEILLHLPNRGQDARADFERAVQLTRKGSPARARAWYRLGQACQRLEDAEAARRSFAKALEVDKQVGGLSDQQRKDAAAAARGA